MVASATTAPATAGASARPTPRAGLLARPPSCRRSRAAARQGPRGRGRGRRTCPRRWGRRRMRATERIVFEVPTAWSGVPAFAAGAARRRSTRAPACGPRAHLPVGGSPGSRSRVTRPAPVAATPRRPGPRPSPGTARASHRRCRRRAGCRPTSRTSGGPRGRWPRLVLTAQHVERDAGALDDGRGTSSTVRGLADALVTKPLRSSTPWSSATSRHSCTKPAEPVSAGVGDQPVVGDVLGEAQVDLVLRGGQSAGRRGGRRRRGGGPCSIRRR